jgi:hypothetical protein
LTAGYHKELWAADEAKRFDLKQSLALRLHNDEGMDFALCNAALDLLCAALFGEGAVPETPIAAENGIAETKIEEETGKIKEIIDETDKEAYTKKIAQITGEADMAKKFAKKRKRWLIALSAALCFAMIFGIVQCSSLQDAKSTVSWQSWQISLLNEEIDNWKNSYENSKKIWLMNITAMKVGNYSYQNSRWVTRPGESLQAANIRYLNPVFTYDSPVTQWMTFYIKIKNPSGDIHRGNRSPEGFSYSREYQVKRGKSLSFDPGGFGSESGGSYESGEWVIEVWCENVCIFSETVQLE